MEALKKFKSHLKSGNSGFALLPFASKKDDSAITAVERNAKGVATRFRIHGTTHGYDFFYDAFTGAITEGASGPPVPESAISPEKYKDRDKNSEAVAGAGHTLSTHEQLDALLRPEDTTKKGISEKKAARNRQEYLERPEVGAQAADQMMRDQEKRTKKALDRAQGVVEALEEAQPPQSAQFIVQGDPADDNPETPRDPNLPKPGSFGIVDQNVYPEPDIDPTLSHLGDQFIEGEERPVGPAKELVQSRAFNAMFGVPAGRHTTIDNQTATLRNGVWVDDSYGDGSEVHYHVHPKPLLTDTNTGRVVHAVTGFDVVVPHLVGQPLKEHTISRRQQIKTGINAAGDPYGAVTHLSHTITMSDQDGQDYVSDPKEHEVGERSQDNQDKPTSLRDVYAMALATARGQFKRYDDKQYRIDRLTDLILRGVRLVPNKKGGVSEAKRTTTNRAGEKIGVGMLDNIDNIMNAPYPMQMALLENLRAHTGAKDSALLKAGESATEVPGAGTPGTVGHAEDLPAKLRRWPHPSSMNPATVQKVMEDIAFARANQEVVPPEETKDNLLQKYGEILHPDNFGRGKKGYVYDPKEKGSIHHQQYVENEYGRMLGMARKMVSRPDKWTNHHEAAQEFLEAHLEVFPTEPGPSGGVDFLNPIRRDVRSKINAAQSEDKPIPETSKPTGRQPWQLLPHEAKIDQVHGGIFTVFHKIGGRRTPSEHTLTEENHPEVFAARTVGELHSALEGIRVPNPVRSRSKIAEGVVPTNASIHATLEGADGPSIIRRGRESGTSAAPVYRIDPGEQVRQSTVAWAVYHPASRTVVQTKRGTVQTFASRNAAVQHAQQRQEQGEDLGHVLIPLHRDTLHPIDTTIPPDDLPKAAHPQRVVGNSVREVPWGPGYHDEGIIAIRQTRHDRAKTIAASSGTYALLGALFPEVGGARSATRTPPNAQGEISRPGFSPAK